MGESTAGTRMFREASPASRVALDDYNDRPAVLLSCPPRMREGAEDVLDPLPLTLTGPASGAGPAAR